MARLAVYPHARCKDNRCSVSQWMHAGGRQFDPVGDYYPGWDYQTEIRIEQTVQLDLDGIREDCGLARSDCVSVLATWKSTATNIRGSSNQVPVSPLEGEEHAQLETAIPGREVGGDLVLHTQVIAVRPDRKGNAARAPSRHGAVLWESRVKRITLEGGGGRFPVELLDFRDVSWLSADAGWHLDWDTQDLTAPLMGSVRLYLNAGHLPVRRAATSPDPGDGDRTVAQAIQWDLGRQLINAALDEEEFEGNADRYEEGTVGKALARLVRSHFPHDSVDSLRQRRSRFPRQFESELQAAFRIFDDD